MLRKYKGSWIFVLSVLKMSIQKPVSLVTFIVLLPASFSIPKPIRSATMGRWVRGGHRIFVKKRYGKTRVGGFLFSVGVEFPFLYLMLFD